MSEHPTTDNHDFPRPEPGTLADEWGTVLNEELTDTLEERTVIVDVAAERDNYAAYADAVFLASDTGQISLGDGDSWEFRGIVPNDSDVLGAIEGETIAPSDIAGLWDGTNVTADVNNDSVHTESLESDSVTVSSSNVADEVDYLDPAWLARTGAKYYIRNGFDELTGIEQATSGSGNIDYRDSQRDVILETGTSSGSARLTSGYSMFLNFDDRITLSTIVRFLDGLDDRVDQITTGGFHEEQRSIGFRVQNGSLEGICHDGTSETSVELLANPSTDPNYRLRAEHNPTDDEITFYVNEVEQGVISSGVPSGEESHGGSLYAQLNRIENTAEVARRQLLREFRVVRVNSGN